MPFNLQNIMNMGQINPKNDNAAVDALTKSIGMGKTASEITSSFLAPQDKADIAGISNLFSSNPAASSGGSSEDDMLATAAAGGTPGGAEAAEGAETALGPWGLLLA